MENIKLIVLDVDGVLTDGRLLIHSDGGESKAFHVKDGMGISLAHFHGMKTAIISGRASEAVRIRAKELNIDFLYEGITNKIEALEEITATLGLTMDQVFYMGDDINDLPIMRMAGFSAAPSDAVSLVRKSVDFVSHFAGGHGAVREAIEYVLTEQVDYDMLVERYLNEQIKVMQ